MSDDTPQIPQDAPAPTEEARVDAPAPGGATRADAPEPEHDSSGPSVANAAEAAQERPEMVVAGAFAGAFLFAKLLRRIGGR